MSPRRHFPGVDALAQSLEVGPGVGHALLDGGPDVGRERARIDLLSRANADLGEAGHQIGLGGMSRAELKDEVEDIVELERSFLLGGRQRLDEGDRRGCGAGRLSEERRKRLGLVTGLHLLDVLEVAGVQQLRAIGGECQLGFRSDNLLDALGCLALPFGSGDEETSAVVAGSTAPDIVEVEGVGVDELDAVIAFLIDRRHREHDGLGAQVHP
jgi:hypothetical protein